MPLSDWSHCYATLQAADAAFPCSPPVLRRKEEQEHKNQVQQKEHKGKVKKVKQEKKLYQKECIYPKTTIALCWMKGNMTRGNLLHGGTNSV